MSGSAVYVTGRLGTPDLVRFKNLIPEAVTRAIYKTKDEMASFFKDPSEVPKLTGRLQNSIVNFVSPGQITFQWSAVDPKTGFNYAFLRNQLGGKSAPPNFAGRALVLAKTLLVNNLEQELQAVTP